MSLEKMAMSAALQQPVFSAQTRPYETAHLLLRRLTDPLLLTPDKVRLLKTGRFIRPLCRRRP